MSPAGPNTRAFSYTVREQQARETRRGVKESRRINGCNNGISVSGPMTLRRFLSSSSHYWTDGAGGSKHSNIWVQENGTNHIHWLPFCLFINHASANIELIKWFPASMLQKVRSLHSDVCINCVYCRVFHALELFPFAGHLGGLKCVSTAVRAPL